jgi:citrate lyase beta subunit
MDLAGLVARLDEQLVDADGELAALYPGTRPGRQPVHTIYVPAHQYGAGLVARYGRAAQIAVAQHGELFLRLIDDDEDLLDRVLTKLEREPVEDLRIDFEDGYGDRGDGAEDQAVAAAASALRTDLDAGLAPSSFGIRFKSLEQPTRERGVRTLVAFLEGILSDGTLPAGFVATLPKVTSVAQVEAMAHICSVVEHEVGLDDHTLVFELQVETPQAIIGPGGTALVAPMIHAAEGRCTGLHYGTYDYSASIGIPAAYQSLDHPSADLAKTVMQAAAAGTGVRLSDGSTNILPVGGEPELERGWETHLRLVRRSLERGFYQGWDLHPHQLPTRYAATFTFFREGLDDATARLRAWAAREPGPVADEPATVKALAGFLVRGVDCGALTSDEVTDSSGHDLGALVDLARPRPATH